MITAQDQQLLKQKGITEEQFNEQLRYFEQGFPFLKLSAAASVEKGILCPSTKERDAYIHAWETYKESNKRIVKFVPASGAASRMFKDLFAFQNASYNTPQTDFEKHFFDEIRQFAFYEDLNQKCIENTGANIDQLKERRDYKLIVAQLLDKEGLNYGALPKGLIKFHNYMEEEYRTPVEEHLSEGCMYAATGLDVTVHFTVSPEHRPLFEALVAEKSKFLEQYYGVRYHVSFSEQKSSTDTVAVTPDNQPFRTEDDSLLFRPGGHGALIENLNDLDVDIIFIKNIDNVVPDRLRPDTVTYKELLAGVLVCLQKQAFAYLEKLDSGMYSMNELREMLQFLQKDLCCKNPETKTLEDTELAIYLKKKLNRPMRVCGMVKNVGEPGGGPFLAYNTDGTISLQILESSQIDMSDPEKRAMFGQCTHFNPVDLVCAVRNYRGEKFNLPDFVDKNTGFISHKSKNGRDLKALELPGLWNGAMSDWNTVFVEVPLSTFNPVKTVNDLLREQHQ